jgi:hypothetical protein
MLEVKTRLVAPALMALAGIALVGCSASKDGPKWPPPPTTVAKANFNLTTGALPYPTDLFFAGSTDGTLNLPSIAYRPASMQSALNALDGWSTSATLDTSFSLPIDPATISGSTVKIIRLWQDPRTKAPANPADPTAAALFLPVGAVSPVAGVLTYGTDFTAAVDDSVDSGGKILRITPLKPFQYSSGPAYNKAPNNGRFLNVGYLVVLTDGLKSTDGQTMGSDTLYSNIKSAPANCSTITDPTQNLVCQLTKAHLGIAQATGTPASSVIMSWSFSTQSIDDTLAYLQTTAQAKPTLIVPAYSAAAGRILNTRDANAGLAGHADIYVGSTQVPYYLAATNPSQPLAAQKAAILASFWTAAGPPVLPTLDQTSRNLTMFNFAPAPTATVTIPLLVTVPNASSTCAGKPAGGWPVAIVQHGITGNRSQALAMADAFADQCILVAAIDLPLHGITNVQDPTKPPDPLVAFHCFAPPKAPNPSCLGAVERTFDADFAKNPSNVPGTPDGVIDPSGTWFINLSSPLTGRDNLREGEADLITLTKSIPTLAVAQAAPGSLPAGPAGVDATRVHYVGLSLGSIVGGSHLEFAGGGTRTATLAVPGGVITKLLLDSKTFGPIISAGVNAQGLAPGTYLFDLYFRDFQAVIDSGDPINHIKDAQANVPLHLIKVLNDTVVPNNSTDRLILQGGLRKLKTLGPNAVGKGTGAYTFFSAGSHGSLFDPTASLAATVEMQKQAVGFAATAVAPGGPFVILTNPAVLDLN